MVLTLDCNSEIGAHVSEIFCYLIFLFDLIKICHKSDIFLLFLTAKCSNKSHSVSLHVGMSVCMFKAISLRTSEAGGHQSALPHTPFSHTHTYMNIQIFVFIIYTYIYIYICKYSQSAFETLFHSLIKSCLYNLFRLNCAICGPKC